MPTTVPCPHCQGGFQVTETAPGTVYDCPLCGGRFRLGGGAPAEPPPLARTAPKRPGVALERTCPACGQRYPTDRNTCPSCKAGFREAKIVAREKAEEAAGSFAPERAAVNMGVVGGLLLLAVAGIWFVAGYFMGYIFYYPFVLAALGVFALLKGMATGNLAGKRRPRGGTRAPRSRRGRR